MPQPSPTDGLGAREREILEVLFRLGEATAQDVRKRLRNDPSDSSVRTMLALLESKGHVRHARRGRQYVYEPAVPRETARRTALAHVVNTFFGGSVDQVMTTLVRDHTSKLTPGEVERLKRLLDGKR